MSTIRMNPVYPVKFTPNCYVSGELEEILSPGVTAGQAKLDCCEIHGAGLQSFRQQQRHLQCKLYTVVSL